MHTAIVIGATGLVGSHLVNLLLESEDVLKVKTFVRRKSGVEHAKLEENVVDFDSPKTWKDKLTGDVLFSAMGTTIKKAGTKKRQYKIDVTYQYQTAKHAAENKVPKYVLVSSPGANEKSLFFYSQIKGELDNKVKQLPFQNISIIKPSVLVGNRNEKRMGEELGIKIGRWITKIPGLKKYRPIKGKTVAKAMIKAAETNTMSYQEYVLDELFSMANQSTDSN